MRQQSSNSFSHWFAIVTMIIVKTGSGSAKSLSFLSSRTHAIALAFCLACITIDCKRSHAQSDEIANAVEEETSPTQWTNPQGKVVEADFLRMDGKVVVLKLKSNGSEVKVPGNSLSLESYLQAVKLSNPKNFSKPVPEASKATLASFNSTVDFTVNDILLSPFDADSTIDQFMGTLERECQRYNMLVVWHALSPKVQSEVAAAFADRASAMSPALRSELQTTLKMVHGILRDKGAMILEMQEVKGDPLMLSQAQSAIPLAQHFFEGVSRDDMWQASQFQAANFPRWLAEMVFITAPIVKELDKMQSTDNNPIQMFALGSGSSGANQGNVAISRSEDDIDPLQMHENSLAAPASEPSTSDITLDVIYNVVSQTADSAEVDLKFSSAENFRRYTFTKENGQWFCKTWSDNLQQQFDTAVRPELGKPMDSMAFSAVLIALNKGLLVTLQNAKTPRELSQALQDSMQMVGSFIGPAMQGFGPMAEPNAMAPMTPMTPTFPSQVAPTQPAQTPVVDPETDPELAP